MVVSLKLSLFERLIFIILVSSSDIEKVLAYSNPATTFTKRGLVEINAPERKRIHGCRGRIATVEESTVEVWVRDVDRIQMHNYNLKHRQVKPLLLEEEPQLEQVCARMPKLRLCHLDPFEVEILNLLDRPVALTPLELEYLVAIEQRYKGSY